MMDQQVLVALLKSDRVNQSAFDRITENFQNLTTHESRSLRYESWCGNYIKFVRNLGTEVMIFQKARLTSYKPEIIAEVSGLTNTLLCLSSVLLEALKAICSEVGHEEACKSNTFGDAKVGAVANWMQESMDQFQKDCSHITNHHVLKKPAVGISAAAFRELFTLNAIYSRGSFDQYQVDDLIQNLKFPPINKNEPNWVPQMLVVVVDTGRKIVCTGSTQMVSANKIFPGLVSREIKHINRLRLGETFTELIDRWSKRFEELVTEYESQVKDVKDEDAGSLYNKVVKKEDSAGFDGIPSPIQDHRIWSMAFQGYDLVKRAPCLRCQKLYREWRLWGSPNGSIDEKKVLKVAINQKWSSPDTQEWSTHYCAETVAAAKIYALSGSVTS